MSQYFIISLNFFTTMICINFLSEIGIQVFVKFLSSFYQVSIRFLSSFYQVSIKFLLSFYPANNSNQDPQPKPTTLALKAELVLKLDSPIHDLVDLITSVLCIWPISDYTQRIRKNAGFFSSPSNLVAQFLNQFREIICSITANNIWWSLATPAYKETVD